MDSSTDEKRRESEEGKESASSRQDVEAQEDVGDALDGMFGLSLRCFIGSRGDGGENGVNHAAEEP